jgi:formylmethanofuran dehydrogenase subunit B
VSGAAVGGRAASLEAAAAEAARILGASRCAVLGGMATDAAGAAAAVALARRIGGVIDHAHSGPLLRDLDVMRTAGWMVATPPEARARADLALLVGTGAAWPGVAAAPVLPPGAASARRVIRLGPGRDAAIAGAETIAAAPAELLGLLGALRAIAAGRPVRLPGARLRALSGVAGALKSARYGVASWSAGTLDALAIEMLCGLIDDLNAQTRFAGLPIAPPGNAAGVAQTCGWLTGFPIRLGFGRGEAEHDPWRFDAARLIAAGEADAVLWIDAIAGSAPSWNVPTVALTARGTRFASPPAVAIAVGRPGVDHDAVLFDPALGTLVAREAEAAGEAPSAAEALGRILAALPC